MFTLQSILDLPAGYELPAAGPVNLLAPAAANYVEHYTKDAEVFDYFEDIDDPATVHENDRLHRAILERVPENARVVLDVGCGKAWVAESLLAEKEAVISFDIASVNVSKALERYPAANHYGVIGDVYALPLRDNSVDCIVSSEVMEHVPDVPAYLASLLRVLKPGGTIIISTPYSEKIAYSLCIHCNQRTPHHAHLHSFNEPTVAKLLGKFPQATYRMTKLSNKLLLLLRTHVLLRHLPFSLWRLLDRGANTLLKKPGRLIIEIFLPAGK